ncbi:hypothetical protein [Sphingobacterium pedocola]|uniref:ABC transporter permease n=1 Tax=Sphingobacterium pedocola TaxID=2082722 RepID=A0ABR9T2P6_9SPHI|nr:hypothetical protein [Sphingobacterium pedocola]MBE8719613.1 hypothetical protein [Sphingobacterium pedocola]
MKKHFYLSPMLILVTWLMTGLSADDEFYGEYNIFLKHRPTCQYYFSSPLSMQDMPQDYPSEKAAAYYNYRDFVLEEHWSSDLDIIALFIVILTVFYVLFVIVGAVKIKRRTHESP